MTIDQLTKRVEALEKELRAQKDSRNIPRDLENALKYRLKGLYGAGATGSFASVDRTINLTGNAQSIDVLENPAGYIPVSYQNATYKVPYWVD